MHTVEIERAFALALLWSAVASVIGAWFAYWLIKSAVRNAIKESGLLEELRSIRARSSALPSDTQPMHDIRAD